MEIASLVPVHAPLAQMETRVNPVTIQTFFTKEIASPVQSIVAHAQLLQIALPAHLDMDYSIIFVSYVLLAPL